MPLDFIGLPGGLGQQVYEVGKKEQALALQAI
jgi:hypothetical protein